MKDEIIGFSLFLVEYIRTKIPNNSNYEALINDEKNN